MKIWTAVTSITKAAAKPMNAHGHFVERDVRMVKLSSKDHTSNRQPAFVRASLSGLLHCARRATGAVARALAHPDPNRPALRRPSLRRRPLPATVVPPEAYKLFGISGLRLPCSPHLYYN
ncbi:hypothetical protein GUJ93_ZPchr0013g36099 [Zizania palustris]|uniref:Uncharacterized protein n=1 Tax=Zizania palustris TaxID=103762 RepID=A0A8J6BY92_ZIZPA|nr:hypothetical protein GUJ93_ZPchr0013g36099 [Zizania palustris]